MNNRTKRVDDLFPRRHDQAGHHLCRRCGKPVPTGRQWWCGPECVDQALMICWPTHQARKVQERDHGICAECGTDTNDLLKWLRSLDHETRRRALHHLSVHGWPTTTDSRWWEVHHIRPVIHGGAEMGIDNLKTLCIPCHKKETKALAAKRAKERKDKRIQDYNAWVDDIKFGARK